MKPKIRRVRNLKRTAKGFNEPDLNKMCLKYKAEKFEFEEGDSTGRVRYRSE